MSENSLMDERYDPHPWYGPCDAIADGACFECRKVIADLKNKQEKRAEKAKHDISTILRLITHDAESKYWYGKFIRWGLVEKDLHAIVDDLMAIEEPSCNCLWCGDNRNGKGSLFVDGKPFCNELHYDRWVDSTDQL